MSSRIRTGVRGILYATAAACLSTAAWGVDWRAGLVVVAGSALVAEALIAPSGRTRT